MAQNKIAVLAVRHSNKRALEFGASIISCCNAFYNSPILSEKRNVLRMTIERHFSCCHSLTKG